jgi:DNA-binding CsgD family transcriptional regulator
MTANRIPAGLLDGGIEFFTVMDGEKPNAKYLMSGGVHPFHSLPAQIKQMLRREMKANPAKDRAMEEMVGKNEDAKLERFTTCNYGALNDEADIDAEGNLSQPEYVPCAFRGQCKHEGKGCSNIMVEGVLLSPAQTRVFRLAKMENKQIAEQLFLSCETVKKHMQTIQEKTGLTNKNEMVHWATIKGII